jgi:hypothetical protein
MENRFVLEVVEGTQPGRRFFLAEGEHSIGRHSQSDICIGAESRIVSKKHACITQKGDTVTIRDCGSVNFTLVNGERIEETALREGDVISLGENGPKLRFVREDSVPTVVKPTPWPLSDDCGAGKSPGGDGAPQIRDTGAPQRMDSMSLAGFDNIGLPLMPGSEKDDGDEGPREANVFTTREIGRVLRGSGAAGAGDFSKSQELLLSKAAKAYRKNRRSTFGIAGAVIAGLLCVAVFYARGYYRYERMIAKGIALKNETRRFDLQYEDLRQADTGFSESKQQALDQLRDRERRLDSIMAQLPFRYQQRFFTDSVERYLCDIMAEFNEPSFRVPPHMLDLVKKYVDKFTGPQKNQSEAIIARKNRYFPYMERRLRAEQVPTVLAYMAMQESGLDPHARSNMDAVGMWQFMKGTAVTYGLRVAPGGDEREDWQKSTDAAAKYLHDLLAFFGEGRGVLLAMAAYNAGEAKVREALRKIRDPLRERDFWHLYRTSNVLAGETREYVPQILARIIIDRHRSVYGIAPEEEKADRGR